MHPRRSDILTLRYLYTVFSASLCSLFAERWGLCHYNSVLTTNGIMAYFVEIIRGMRAETGMRYFVVTGAGEGLGKCFALELARKGINLVLTALPGFVSCPCAFTAWLPCPRVASPAVSGGLRNNGYLHEPGNSFHGQFATCGRNDRGHILSS